MTDSPSSVEEWRKSVDKTLDYYKDKIKALKTNNKSRVKKLQTSWQREKRALNNKIKSLENQNQSLQEKFAELRTIKKPIKP